MVGKDQLHFVQIISMESVCFGLGDGWWLHMQGAMKTLKGKYLAIQSKNDVGTRQY